MGQHLDNTRRRADHLRVERATTAISGSLRTALHWYQSEPLSAFGNETACRLVSAGRAEAVSSYLALIGSGAAG